MKKERGREEEGEEGDVTQPSEQGARVGIMVEVVRAGKIGDGKIGDGIGDRGSESLVYSWETRRRG